MSIRIEITGENTQEIAQSILQMAFMIAPRLAASQAAPAEAVAETVQPVKKPARAKKADAPTIEHDESEVKTDVRADTASEQPGSSAAQPSGDASAEADGVSAGAAQDNEAAAEVDAVAEPALTIDQLRAFTINEYLNTVFEKQEDRKNAYGALLERFQIKAITALPVEKINEFKAAVDAKIAEALVGK
ncbi:hypothetical protein [Mesorhizobium sp. M0139]|uniref:hypothetical protein n=1 Tax=Mesorhizobium sp. M0139 TaxID=2956892 RepID=UPI0033399499